MIAVSFQAGLVCTALDQLGDVLLARDEVGVAGVLVLGAERLDERDRGQRARLARGHEIGLVLEVRRGRGVPSA